MVRKSFARFVLAGGSNTFLSYMIYLFLLTFIDYQMAYTISFIFGIAFSYFANVIWVFEEKIKLKSMTLYPLVYLAQYLIGILILTTLVDIFGIDSRVAPLLVVVLTLPVIYVVNKFIITGKTNESSS